MKRYEHIDINIEGDNLWDMLEEAIQKSSIIIDEKNKTKQKQYQSIKRKIK